MFNAFVFKGDGDIGGPEEPPRVMILLEQFDMTGAEQKEFHDSFTKAAIARYGKARR